VIVTPELPLVNMRSPEIAIPRLTDNATRLQTRFVSPTPRYLLACVLAATLGGAAACADAASTPPSPPAPVQSSGAPGFFGGTDLAWIQINIAMDEQLAPLLALPSAHSRNDRVKDLNAQVKTFSVAELETLRRLNNEAKLPTENPHEGMPMPGMVQNDDVRNAAAASGPAFDTLYLSLLQAHLEQGASLATSEIKAGLEPDTLALAEQVLATRTEYLPAVRKLVAE
jgi:uncharacterized protein (DUF305 family)